MDTLIILQYDILYVKHNDNIKSSSICQRITAYHTNIIYIASFQTRFRSVSS